MSEEIARDLQDRAAAQYEALTETVRAFVEWEMERAKRRIKAVSTVEFYRKFIVAEKWCRAE